MGPCHAIAFHPEPDRRPDDRGTGRRDRRDQLGDRPAGNGSPLLAEAARQLQAYFDGKLSHFDLPLAPAGSPFEKCVWSAMQKIPYGETRCYGDLAADIRSAPRAVGGACGKNPIPIVIPCHRVLAKGGLGGYSGAGGLDTKQTLLRLPGGLPKNP